MKTLILLVLLPTLAFAQFTGAPAADPNQQPSSEPTECPSPMFPILRAMCMSGKRKMATDRDLRIAAAQKRLTDDLVTKLADARFDVLRTKVELRHLPMDSVPFAMAINESFPADDELPLIKAWAELREQYLKDTESTLYPLNPDTDFSLVNFHMWRIICTKAQGFTGSLIVALYQQKLTYAEFAEQRAAVSREGEEECTKFAAQLTAPQPVAYSWSWSESWSTYTASVQTRAPRAVLRRR